MSAITIGFSQPRSRGYALAALMAALLGAAVVLYMTRTLGLALTPDSLQYLAAAKNLAEGHGLRGYDNAPFVTWPPLLPIVLALLQTAGMEGVHGLRLFYALLNALVLGFSVCWVGRCDVFSLIRRNDSLRQDVPGRARRSSGSGVHASDDGSRDLPLWAAFLFAATVVCALPQLRVAGTAWSELLFIALALICLYATVAAVVAWNGKAFAVAIVAAALACLSRYSAITLLSSCGLLFLFVGNSGFGKRLKHSVAFTLAASLPLALWMIRNWHVSGTLTGPRHPTVFHLGESTSLLGASIPKLFLPSKLVALLPGHVWLLLFVLFWVALFWYSVRSLQRNPLTFRRVSRLALVLYLGCSFLVLVVAFTIIAMDTPNDRLWAPVVVPSLILLGLFLERKHSWRSWAATLILAAVMISGVTRLPNSIERFQEQDAVYALPRWQHSPLVQYLREHSPEGIVLSNQPEILHYLCGIQVQLTPRLKNFSSKNIWIQQDELLRFEAAVKRAHGAYIVWFDETRGYLFPLEWLEKYYPIQPITQVADGKVVYVSNFEGSIVIDTKEAYRKKK